MNIGEYKVKITRAIVVALSGAFVVSIMGVAALPIVLAVFKSIYWMFLYMAYLPVLFVMYFKKG